MIKKILIIRFRRVGDAVISSSLCASLKKSFPNAEIHYVLNENIASLFQHHPAIDKIITFSDHDMSSTWRYIKKVKKTVREEKYDIIVDTRSTVKTLMFSLFSLRTKYRVGRRKMYNPLIENYRVDNSYRGGKDNVELTLSLLDPLERDFKIQKDTAFRLYCTEEEKSSYKEYMLSKGVDFSKPIIVGAVAVRLEHKMWALEKMKELLARLLEKYDVQIIFNHAGEKERNVAEKLHESMDFNNRIFVDVEAKSLRELVALMANSSLFFGNEGGPRHISQAMDLPSLAIYPPNTAMENWLPNKSERFRGIDLKTIDLNLALSKDLSYEEKFKLIDVDSVWNALDEMLMSLDFPLLKKEKTII